MGINHGASPQNLQWGTLMQIVFQIFKKCGPEFTKTRQSLEFGVEVTNANCLPDFQKIRLRIHQNMPFQAKKFIFFRKGVLYGLSPDPALVNPTILATNQAIWIRLCIPRRLRRGLEVLVDFLC